MIQLTTIRGIYTPRALFSAGKYACSNNWIIVTNDATITINAGIRTLSGITLRSNEMNAFERISTAVVVRPIPRPFIADDVTARVGHIPSIITKVGFSVIIPFFKRSVQEFISSPP